MVPDISWWALACLNSQYSPVTRCKNFASGKISPLFLTAKFSPRNSPLLKSPPPVGAKKPHFGPQNCLICRAGLQSMPSSTCTYKGHRNVHSTTFIMRTGLCSQRYCGWHVARTNHQWLFGGWWWLFGATAGATTATYAQWALAQTPWHPRKAAVVYVADRWAVAGLGPEFVHPVVALALAPKVLQICPGAFLWRPWSGYCPSPWPCGSVNDEPGGRGGVPQTSCFGCEVRSALMCGVPHPIPRGLCPVSGVCRLSKLRAPSRAEQWGGPLDPKVGVPKMAQQDFPGCKFRVFPRQSLWSGGGPWVLIIRKPPPPPPKKGLGCTRCSLYQDDVVPNSAGSGTAPL